MFRLAKELGMTVERLSNEMSYPELIEWIAHFRLEHQDAKDAHEAAEANRAMLTQKMQPLGRRH